MATDLAERSLASLFRLDGKVAVVTGGAQGIGSAIARRMSEAGAKVAVGDLNGAAAESLAGELGHAHGGSALGVVLDVTAQADVESFADLVVERYGRLDVWVNNAGIFP